MGGVSDCYRLSETRRRARLGRFEVRGCQWFEDILGERFEYSEIRDKTRGLDGERTLTDENRPCFVRNTLHTPTKPTPSASLATSDLVTSQYRMSRKIYFHYISSN